MKTKQEVEKNVLQSAANVCVESCQKLAAEIERAKEKLLAELRETPQLPGQLLKLALNEAEALAWQEGYPHLLFPALALEKVQVAAKWDARQRFLRRKNSVRMMSI